MAELLDLPDRIPAARLAASELLNRGERSISIRPRSLIEASIS